MRRLVSLFATMALAMAAPVFGQEEQPTKAKDVRALARLGANAFPSLKQLLSSTDSAIRVEAVRTIVEINSPGGLDLLITACRDNDPDVQQRAVEGMVNFYLPGYVSRGIGGSIKKVSSGVMSRFSDQNDQVIDPYITARPDVVTAIGKVASGSASMDSRAAAARAVGILRGKDAVNDLIEGARSKNDAVIYESLVALQKIQARDAGPKVAFLVKDFNEKVQTTAVETMGVLRNMEALPDLKEVFQRTKKDRVRRSALTAIAMLPDPSNRAVLLASVNSKDEALRGAAAEGLGRIKNAEDLNALQTAFDGESKPSPRISQAFALVLLGKTEISEFSPLQLLVNSLNSAARRGEAFPLLAELAREEAIRKAIYTRLPGGTKDEKIQLAGILARAGGADSAEPLETLTKDSDAEVGREASRALRNLKARL